MSFSLWLLVLGCILLTLGLASAYLRLLPVSTSFIYLLFGLAIGPAGLHAWRSGLADISGWFEHLSEAALLISLFIGGLKLRLPLRSPAWTAAWLLAGPVLLGCILGLTLGAHFLFGLDWGLALLVAAILAPTDPVLASDIQVNHAGGPMSAPTRWAAGASSPASPPGSACATPRWRRWDTPRHRPRRRRPPPTCARPGRPAAPSSMAPTAANTRRWQPAR